MLNKRPIFILGFQHGGTNIVLNLLRSHPEVCSPRGEIQEVFKGKGFPRRFKEPASVVLSKLWNYLPVLAAQRQDVFSLDLWEDRKALSKRAMQCIDKVLFDEKLKARGPTQNCYKSEGVRYTDEEIARSRLLSKNLGGLVCLSNDLARMYPDATFIALVRNGYAMCEGHIRRGVSLAKIAQDYERGCQRIIADSKKIPNYHIFRFEDLLESPRDVFEQIFGYAGLDVGQIRKVRLENKKTVGKDGGHTYTYEQDQEGLIWYPIEKFMDHFKADVNRNQIERLTRRQIEDISDIAKTSLEYFTYDKPRKP
ncbi:sulfotransferase family protein [Thiogranum longum]|uniref:Sulfotransferase family protein n=1 Tax=Thiogranum longum TaxID=1537524 RepID=A0A4R1HGR5_9GAMM|nr:sulfotransferase [Thiogranum longum]TCK19480.1 sulfotransferase family protein [Thiogranum longum]